ncbi:MAG TPA: DUF692 domain-containing protein [Thermoanaerobaculia bacterium]|nr:DUF692 domain-containing protein [Thermoanaerobaculia bacterium]
MRFGLGWRPELGAGIFANLDRIAVVEVLAEELFGADAAQRRAMRFLRTQVPVVLHATSLGLASTERVDARRLDAVARVIGWLEPELWSEHLAFVRAGGTEIGHLAAPPRTDATLEGLARNVAEARRVTGSMPLLENVASLVEPPGSTYSEYEWLHAVPYDLLLDLHNLYANAVNFGFDAAAVVRSLPASRIKAVHLAGGRRIERGRVLDDHLHPVPDAVFDLFALVRGDATVILERDGQYPPIEDLLEELERASRVTAVMDDTPIAALPSRGSSEAVSLETLAKLYTDEAALEAFLADPRTEVDRDDLRLAFRSFARKRLNAQQCRESHGPGPRRMPATE